MMQCGVCHHFVYPITPATEVMKYTAAHIHEVGGRMFQPESELTVITSPTRRRFDCAVPSLSRMNYLAIKAPIFLDRHTV
jgi:hypothetical protein